MPRVEKIKLKKDYALFDKVFFEGEEFYVTPPYRHDDSTTMEMSDMFDTDGEKLGEIKGHYFDFDKREAFERVDD